MISLILDGSGYVEDGREIFDDDLDSESIAQASKGSDGRKRKKNVSKITTKGNIDAMLSNMPEKKKKVYCVFFMPNILIWETSTLDLY